MLRSPSSPLIADKTHEETILPPALPADSSPNVEPVTAPSPSARPHLGYIDGLRGVAALYVVLYHCHGDTVGNCGIPSGVAKIVAAPLGLGHQAVDLFIVLSGFCLMLPALKNGYRLRDGFTVFLYKRARRILPPYYAALILSVVGVTSASAILHGPPFNVPQLTLYGVLAHLFLLQDVFVNTLNQINQVFWSISVEWRIYLALPALLFLWRRYSPWIALLASAVTTIFCFVLLPLCGFVAVTEDLRGPMPHYLVLFTMGLVASDIAYGTSPSLAKLRRLRVPLGLVTVVLAVMSVLAAKYSFGKSEAFTGISDCISGVCAATLMVYLAKQPDSRLCRLLATRSLTFCGTFAYSIYLTHLIALRFVESVIFKNVTAAYLATLGIIIVVAVPTVLLLAYCFFLLFERPFLSPVTKKVAAQVQ